MLLFEVVRVSFDSLRANAMRSLLTMLGVGAAAGMGSALIMHGAFGWNTVVGVNSVVLAFAFSGTVGVLFGVWPARRAAGLDPIEALRFE